MSTLVLLSVFIFVEAQAQMMAKPEIKKGRLFFTFAFLEFIIVFRSSGKDMQQYDVVCFK